MIGLVWEWGIFGTLSLDFHAGCGRLFWGTRSQKGFQVCLGSAVGHCTLARRHSCTRGWEVPHSLAREADSCP